jgi:hypothetical protein
LIFADLVQAALEKSEHLHRERKRREEEEEEERKKASHEVKFNMEVVYHDDESKISAVNHDDDEYVVWEGEGEEEKEVVT